MKVEVLAANGQALIGPDTCHCCGLPKQPRGMTEKTENRSRDPRRLATMPEHPGDGDGAAGAGGEAGLIGQGGLGSAAQETVRGTDCAVERDGYAVTGEAGDHCGLISESKQTVLAVPEAPSIWDARNSRPFTGRAGGAEPVGEYWRFASKRRNQLRGLSSSLA